MKISSNVNTTLLLTATLAESKEFGTKPLTTSEYSALLSKLRENRQVLTSLIEESDNDAAELISGLYKDHLDKQERIKKLLKRGPALALSVEKWHRAGIWFLDRESDDFPSKLNKLNKNVCPALYGCGDEKILQSMIPKVAVVGSRDASHDDKDFAYKLGMSCAEKNYPVVSGCARGTDQASMFGALENGGTAIGVVNELLKKSTYSMYSKHIRDGRLLLLSPFSPENFVGSNGKNQWDKYLYYTQVSERNKYIYCLADVAIVVSSEIKKGGTWKGAIENIENKWVPLYVHYHPDFEKSGNTELVENYNVNQLPEKTLEDISVLFKGQ